MSSWRSMVKCILGNCGGGGGRCAGGVCWDRVLGGVERELVWDRLWWVKCERRGPVYLMCSQSHWNFEVQLYKKLLA